VDNGIGLSDELSMRLVNCGARM